MSNLETVKAITCNLRTILTSKGIHFSRQTYDDDKNIPASLLPLGQILYRGEDFEYTHGQRPGYIEALFAVRIVLKERDYNGMIRAQQALVHKIREALTVGSLNTGSLAASRYISRVSTRGVEVELGASLSTIVYNVAVRYRAV